MTDTERRDAAMSWLARNVAWSRRVDALRDASRRGPVLVRLSPADGRAHHREDAHDRVA